MLAEPDDSDTRGALDDLELTAATPANRSVLATVDLEEETVLGATMVLEIDESNIVTNESDGDGTTITVETNGTTADP